jgi:signal transduction histidine kinase
MMLQAAAAVFNKDGKRAEKLITDARDYAERGINEIRHILRDVRDYAEVSLSLQNELYSVGDIFQKATGVEISIQYGNWPRSFSKPMDAFFTSFAQEALTNALKHGQATEIFIFCQDSGGIVSMTVSDNGAGAKLPVEKGIGISSLEDIANQYGGAVSMSSNKSGFKITVSVSRQTMEDGG